MPTLVVPTGVYEIPAGSRDDSSTKHQEIREFAAVVVSVVDRPPPAPVLVVSTAGVGSTNAEPQRSTAMEWKLDPDGVLVIENDPGEPEMVVTQVPDQPLKPPGAD